MNDQGVVWRNGQLVPFADATCHVLSHMAARGSQVFDVLAVTPTADGPCAVGLRPHVTRFLRSAELMGMQEVGGVRELEVAVAQTVLANASDVGHNAHYAGSFIVKLVAAWTEEAIGVMPASIKPTVYVLALPTGVEGQLEVMGQPVKVKSSSVPKIPRDILPPSLKVAASYTPGVREQMLARAEGFDYPIFKTVEGDLAESTTLSVLLVKSERLLVPPLDSVLDGISRRAILDVAQYASIPVEVRGIRWSELLEADEIILASTSHVVTPVSQLDDRTFDAPGPVAAKLGADMTELYGGSHRLSSQWLTPLASIA